MPESEAVIKWNMDFHFSFATARKAFMDSGEFQRQILPPVYYYPSGSAEYSRGPSQSLALAAIVKNEAANIENMLRSILPIIDYVSLVDTGSTDKTKNIAKNILEQFNVKHIIVDLDFVDFSQARNRALDLVPVDIEWTLILDADEHLVPEDYANLIALLDQPYDVWALPRYNFQDSNKVRAASPYPDYQKRLVRNRYEAPIRFRGAVHEALAEPFDVAEAPFNTVAIGGNKGGPHIHHLSLAPLTRRKRRRKVNFTQP